MGGKKKEKRNKTKQKLNPFNFTWGLTTHLLNASKTLAFEEYWLLKNCMCPCICTYICINKDGKKKKKTFFFSPLFDYPNVKINEEKNPLSLYAKLWTEKCDCFKIEGICTFNFKFWSELSWVSFTVQALVTLTLVLLKGLIFFP